MATLLVVLSGLCLLGALAWPEDIPVLAPVGAAAVVAASFLTPTVGALALLVAVAGGVVAVFGLAVFHELIHPVVLPRERHPRAMTPG